MDKKTDIIIVTAATILFGIFSRVTVRIPYMAWGYFDQAFLLSFLWWFLYTGSLYVAVREYMDNVDSYLKIILQALLFGAATVFLKTGTDALTEKMVSQSGNMMITVFVMELVLLFFGSVVIAFLYYFVAKRTIFPWKDSFDIYAKILTGTIVAYIGIVCYYLLKIDWALERYSGAVQEIGEEQAKLNLSTKFAQESTTVGMIVYIVFFITLWLAFRKNAEKRS